MAYILGSIPFGLIIGKIKRVDIRKVGSGNIGATNVARTLGKKYGLATLILDIAKGVIPVVACRIMITDGANLDFWLAMTGFAAVAGHCYPIFLGFRGGKGVATAAGTFLAICPLALVPAILLFVLIVKRWGYVSAGSLATAASTPLFIHFICHSPRIEIMAWAIAAVIWIKHKDNIKRLAKGEEKSWKKKKVKTQDQGL